MEYGESTECLYIFSVVPIWLWTKYRRKQVQNFRAPLSTECRGKLLTSIVLFLFCAFSRSAARSKRGPMGRPVERTLYTGLPDFLDLHWASLSAALKIGRKTFALLDPWTSSGLPEEFLDYHELP